MITEHSRALSRRSVSHNFAGSPEDLDGVSLVDIVLLADRVISLSPAVSSISSR